MEQTKLLNLNLISAGAKNWHELAWANYIKLDGLGWVFPVVHACYYVAGMGNATALTTASVGGGVLRAMPLIVARDCSVDRLGIRVYSSASGNARLGLYSCDGYNAYPYQCLVQGEISVSSTGAREITLENPIRLSPGLYWLALLNSVSVSLYCLQIQGCFPILGFASITASPGVGWSVGRAYGELPETFPSGSSPITASPIPAIFARIMLG